ncbi:hypothetical protein J4H92_14020 [Leucobacter weissii]|uniref:DUF5666 domain-containing protein n=1 Tax=Leucobacter weissii TaxID=1983706 RepID=A0A939MLB3_9MICO|nr:hypothetical protein [Leucobacter weissii]MBO1903059.1 hypothetical protein [Leucobacter weissii]
MNTITRPASRALLAAGILSVSLLGLAGCSATEDGTAASDTATNSVPSSESPQGPQGVSGEIALVSDGLLQVQGTDSQTAVSYTSETEITEQVAGSLDDVTVGVCINASGAAEDEDSTDEDSTTAARVTISEAVDGSCAPSGMGGGPSGSAPEGAPEGAENGEMPEPPADGSGAPAEGAEDGSGERPEMPGGGFGGFTSGLVTAVDGETITVETASAGGDADSDETGSAEVIVDDATEFTTTREASSEALVVGECVAAQGEYDGEEYAATSLRISEADDDGCSTGFGGGPGGQGGPAPQGEQGDEQSTSESEAANAEQ